MLENNVCENEFDDEEIYLNWNDLVNLRESVEFKEASDKFEHYLEDYAWATRMPQSVLSDICHLAADATLEAMRFCFMKGFEMGGNVMKIVLKEESNSDTENKENMMAF